MSSVVGQGCHLSFAFRAALPSRCVGATPDPSPLTHHATSAAGSSTNNVSAATQCTPCAAGRASTSVNGANAGADGCLVCPAGSSSSYGQFECSACGAGRYAAKEESTACTDCGELGSCELDHAVCELS